MEIVKIKTVKLAPNTGQVEGLPKNPRQWTKGDIDRLARSLEDTPELFEARPCLVYPQGGQFVILGGNMRYEAAKRNGAKEVPCIVFPESTSVEKLREIVIKDNGAFGSWDFDDLANEWDDLPLTDWGVPAWDAEQAVKAEDFGTDFTLSDKPKEPFRQVTFQMADEMAIVLQLITKAAQYTPAYQELGEGVADENKNGVAIYVIAKQWADANLSGFSDVDFQEAEDQENDLREYLRDALAKSGRKAKEVDEHLGTNGMSGHYFGTSQWLFPTYGAYMKMREILPLDRDYFECKKIDMRAKFLQSLKEYKDDGQS